MKLKTLFWIGLSVILLFSCEERTDISIVEIEFQLVSDIQIRSVISENPQLKTNLTLNYSFTGSCIFCLKHNDDLKNCRNNIVCIKPSGSFIIKIRGNSNFEITSVANLKIPIIVETESFTPRFTVF